ncbi:MAG: hypothetical protein ACK56F_14810 [bacterium]
MQKTLLHPNLTTIQRLRIPLRRSRSKNRTSLASTTIVPTP